jgi:alkanesulfonate monooxygenase
MTTPIDVYWRISTGGDKSTVRSVARRRGGWESLTGSSLAPGLRDGAPDSYMYLDHMGDVARAAEACGFYGALLVNFLHTDEPWVTAASLAAETRTLRFMVAFQPGFLNPVYAARLAASLQRSSGGRLVYNVITGGGGPSQLWWGDRVDHDDRYARTTEFLDVHKGVWGTHPFDYDGRFFHVDGGSLPPTLAAQPFPEIYFSGSSAAAVESAGRHADYYLSWLEPLDGLRAKFAQVRERAAAQGRVAKFAVRVEILARSTPEAAWAEVARAWQHVDPAAIGSSLRAGSESVGVQRRNEFLPSTITGYRDLELSSSVWGGFSLIRASGPAFGLVGSYEQVAERLDDLIELGVDAFILAGVPHLETAYRVGEEVLPLLSGRNLRRPVLSTNDLVTA